MSSSNDFFLALHALRIKGFASTDAIAESTSIDCRQVGELLAAAQEAGLVQLRTGRIEGWRITAAGRDAHGELLAEEATRLDAGSPPLNDLYGRFSDVNTVFKEVCTSWQLRDASTMNDHTDTDYDAAVIGRLFDIHATVSDLCAEFSRAVDRFGRYPTRFEDALSRVRDGDHDALTKPLSGSYHDVWMELHEDLLVTLRLERTAADT